MIIILDYRNLNGFAVKISAEITKVSLKLTLTLTLPNVRLKLTLTHFFN